MPRDEPWLRGLCEDCRETCNLQHILSSSSIKLDESVCLNSALCLAKYQVQWYLVLLIIEYYKTLRQFLPNTKTMLLAVPARRSYLEEGSLMVRVLQDPPGVSRISVESSLVHVPPGLCIPPVTSRTWIIMM